MTADLRSGNLDLAIYPANTPVEAVGSFDLDELNLFSTPADQSTQLFFKMDDDVEGPLADPAIRQALRLALDRQAIIDATASGQGILVEGPWTYDNRYRDAFDLRFVKPNVEQATTILNEAGWVIEDEVGIYFQKDETDLSFDLLVPTQGNYSEIAAEMARQWREVGVLVNVETVPPANYQTALENRQFDATIQKVVLTADPDLYDFWSQEAIIRGQNFARWNESVWTLGLTLCPLLTHKKISDLHIL